VPKSSTLRCTPNARSARSAPIADSASCIRVFSVISSQTEPGSTPVRSRMRAVSAGRVGSASWRGDRFTLMNSGGASSAIHDGW
jgi:hypothetical protein